MAQKEEMLTLGLPASIHHAAFSEPILTQLQLLHICDKPVIHCPTPTLAIKSAFAEHVPFEIKYTPIELIMFSLKIRKYKAAEMVMHLRALAALLGGAGLQTQHPH